MNVNQDTRWLMVNDEECLKWKIVYFCEVLPTPRVDIAKTVRSGV